jgi:Zn-dependent protease with chaperone function
MWRLPTPEFIVLIYGPDLPPSGVRGSAHFEPGVLVVQGKGHWFTVQSDRISLEVGGYDGRQWLISWHSSAGPVTAMLQGDDAVHEFIRVAPPEIAGKLRRAWKVHAHRNLRFRLGMALLGLVLLLPLLALGVFWVNADRVSQWVVEQISLEQEKKLGELAFEQMRPKLKLIERGSAPDVVELIGVRLTGGSQKYHYRFHVAEDPQVNAFALPGGHVVVFTGLLRSAQSADEVAGVLAHEASHIRLRHALRNMIHALGWRAVLGVALGDYSGGIWGDMARELGELSYSRDLEREADLEGLVLLRRAGLPPEGMASFYERLAKLEKAPPPLLSSHPAGMERLAALREAIESQGRYTSQSMAVDWAGVRRELRMR